MFTNWKVASPLIFFGGLGAIGAAVAGAMGAGVWAAAAPVIGTALGAMFTDSPKTVQDKVEEAHQTPPDQPLP